MKFIQYFNWIVNNAFTCNGLLEDSVSSSWWHPRKILEKHLKWKSWIPWYFVWSFGNLVVIMGNLVDGTVQQGIRSNKKIKRSGWRNAPCSSIWTKKVIFNTSTAIRVWSKKSSLAKNNLELTALALIL